jgi:hypothetical protein
MQSPILQVLTPVRTEKKSWEGKAYQVNSIQALVHLLDREGNQYPTTVKIKLSDEDARTVKVGQKYALSASSFYEKEGQLHFSPKIGPAVADAAQGTPPVRAA